MTEQSNAARREAANYADVLLMQIEDARVQGELVSPVHALRAQLLADMCHEPDWPTGSDEVTPKQAAGLSDEERSPRWCEELVYSALGRLVATKVRPKHPGGATVPYIDRSETPQPPLDEVRINQLPPRQKDVLELLALGGVMSIRTLQDKLQAKLGNDVNIQVVRGHLSELRDLGAVQMLGAASTTRYCIARKLLPMLCQVFTNQTQGTAEE
jgi:hypothetical protein